MLIYTGFVSSTEEADVSQKLPKSKSETQHCFKEDGGFYRRWRPEKNSCRIQCANLSLFQEL